MNWDYIACFIDTDGNLGINKSNLVRIAFSNTNEEVLKEMRKFMRCGAIHTCIKGSKTSFQKKTVYKLAVCNQIYCLALLIHVTNRMVIKRKRAEECLAFLREKIKTMSRRPKCKSGFCWCPQCNRWLKRDKFSTLKRKGTNVPNAYCRKCLRKRNRQWRDKHPHYDMELRKRKLESL